MATLMRLVIAACGIGTIVGVVFVGRDAGACSRVLYSSKDSRFVLVGRNMDWIEDMRSNIWVFPRGIKRDGLAAVNSLDWTAKYGSIGVSGYDVGTTDGMNEVGLDGNMLWLAESHFGSRDESRPGLSVSLWLQFCLDNFATVDEAVTYFESHDIQILEASVGDSFKKPITVHLSLGDKSGDSAVIEYVGGTAKIYHGRQARIMTNSPTFEKQLEGLKPYQGFGGKADLPGSVDAADRFVRAAYYVGRLPEPKNERQAVAGLLSVMRNVSQPFGPSKPGEPNTSATLWRTVADLTHGVYYFESTTSPNIIWVELKGLDFREGAKVRKLDLVHSPDRVGNVTGAFLDAIPFTPLPPDPAK
jgi:penicillin V acylase-like amidase (Ntn superfamily)